MDIKEEAIAALKLSDHRIMMSYPPVPDRASVLVPLMVKDGELHTLMTQRSKKLRKSASAVCFPGGKRDPTDREDVDTALREAQEEIGLPPADVKVVSMLAPLWSEQSKLLVRPVVGFIEDSFCPSPNPDEVSAVFTVPLRFFTSSQHHTAMSSGQWKGKVHSFYFEDPDSGRQYHIWGLTAFIAVHVASIALGKKPEFDFDLNFDHPIKLHQNWMEMNRKVNTVSKL
ncbi:peroxisomal coenzyme A diphosphatase NUDT7 [Mugil cephalus]|uniref:peroxisomal coenzyme A diphosphatase NUDT7 n=1 Tax=Mugil cephalus TaxID=48193 RepID=UPI001FB6789B|nr:peroxisomal coenzyme A diphosphatase NUDT7 [Mugil cephalus]XP_047451927.1 peroxisomal coenzyme A diphosphatase NUDT7 [Mugil cephalus]XP_047451928.1 peroxisomal coenzyme A diphosphatase NUDT7 [Mugil cephalus]